MSNLKDKLEKVHALLINEEHEQADILFHEAFVEAAKEVHTDIMEEEEWMEEDFDIQNTEEDIDQEEYFGEDEFEDEGAVDPDVEDAASDIEDPMMDDDIEGEEGEEFSSEEAPATPADAIADIQAAIDVLQQEFEAETNGAEQSELDGDEFAPEEEGEDAFASDEEEDEVAEESYDPNMYESDDDDDSDEECDDAKDLDEGEELSTKGNGPSEAGHPDGGKNAGEPSSAHDKRTKPKGQKDPAPGKKAYMEDSEAELDEDDQELEEAFDELDESFELESVTQGNTHAQIGTGGESFSSNEKSVGLQKKLGQRVGGDAVNPRAKGKDHKGYDMENSPAVSDMKKRKNVRGRSTDEQTSVSKEGDSSALINKDHSDGYGAENTKSLIGSKGSVQAKGLTEGKKRVAKKAPAKKRTRKASK